VASVLRNLESESDLRGKLACRNVLMDYFVLWKVMTLRIKVARAVGSKRCA